MARVGWMGRCGKREKGGLTSRQRRLHLRPLLQNPLDYLGSQGSQGSLLPGLDPRFRTVGGEGSSGNCYDSLQAPLLSTSGRSPARLLVRWCHHCVGDDVEMMAES